MTDQRLGELLRVALPPAEDAAPRRDLWPALVERLDEGSHWSLLDLGLGLAALLSLAIFPEWLVPLVYHM